MQFVIESAQISLKLRTICTTTLFLQFGDLIVNLLKSRSFIRAVLCSNSILHYRVDKVRHISKSGFGEKQATAAALFGNC